MTYSTDPVLDADRYFSALTQEEGERAARIAYLKESFLKALQGDVTTLAHFAPRTGWRDSSTTVADVMLDAMDSKNFCPRLMQVVANAAAGKGCQRDAAQLLEEVAEHWADREADY